jgi:hypothetical protein
MLTYADVCSSRQVAQETAPCYVSTNSLRRMRKRAQTVVKDNWLPRDISLRTKGMALPVKGGVGGSESTRGRTRKGAGAGAAQTPATRGGGGGGGGGAEAKFEKVAEKGEGSNGSDMVVMEQVDQAAASPALMLTLAAAPPPRSPPSPLLTSPDPLNTQNPGAASSEVAAPTSDELSLQQDALKEEVEESGLWPMSSGHVGTETEEGSGSKGIDAEAEGVAAPAIVHDCMLAT